MAEGTVGDMRVLVAHSFYRLAGGEDRYVDQQVGLLARRHDVELFARRNEDLGGGLATATRMVYARALREEAQQVVRNLRPDVVHLHNAYPSLGPALHLAAQREGVPLVMTVHNYRLRCPNGYMFTEGAPCRRCEAGLYAHAVAHHCFASPAQAAGYAVALWTHRFLLGLDRKVALFIAPSEFVRARMLEWGFPPERVTVVRNFTDTFAPLAQPGTYGTYLGRLSDEKGLDVLLRALAEAGDPPFRLIGDGPARGSLQALAARLGLAHTEFCGQVAPSRVPSLLRAARFVVFSSVWDENAPIAALEALAAGRPLLVTRTGGLPELVAEGEGLVCEVGDVSGLAANVRALQGDDQLCARLGEGARRRAGAEFTPERHLERLEAAYDRVAKSTKTGARSKSA
jgi:glycosyltransferase involved in cell wall biosynthesis